MGHLRIPLGTKKRIRNIRNFLVALGLIAMTGGKGRAFIYDWNRNRQQRMKEEYKKKKRREEETRKLLVARKHDD